MPRGGNSALRRGHNDHFALQPPMSLRNARFRVKILAVGTRSVPTASGCCGASQIPTFRARALFRPPKYRPATTFWTLLAYPARALRAAAHGRPAPFMITEPFPGYSGKRFRDHESVALAPHGWAGFHRTAGHFAPQRRAHRAAAGPRRQTDTGFRPHRTIPPRDSQQIIAASPPAEAGAMVAAGAFGNGPTESIPEYKVLTDSRDHGCRAGWCTATPIMTRAIPVRSAAVGS